MADQLASLQTDIGLKWYLQQQRKRRRESQSAPEALSAPTISGGTAPADEAEVSDDSSFRSSSPMTYTYQWQANDADIPGATLKTLLLLVGMVGQAIRCVVTATNSYGSTASISVVIMVAL